ncbi:glycoside hydrolase family 17 protein [Xylaria bambusicola]|uniref:glycoside hydrolase family 17 protein n=1 Tax=Xylaria bambusicola TaxID=326684 RepID=UPI00200761F4|nr:glycoside hydrolase family 17 protein [Xylaria bambusicola]KAI0503342.1 glycoside hydrolase family 17 protein [Xylaria bambusicola]
MRFFTISLALFSLLRLSVGQPKHGHHRFQHRNNRAFHAKRDRITISDASYPDPTEFPEVVVYVDQYGNPIRTATETVVYVPKETPPSPPPPPNSTPPVVESSPISSSPTPSAVEFTPEPSSKQQPSLVTPAETPDSSPLPDSAESDTSSPGSGLHGVTYSPYKGDGNCKTADEVDRDFSLFSQDYGVVRLYGVDCDQVSTVSKAAKKYGNKLFLGIFDIDTVDSAVATMAADLENDWSMVDTVSVGNELVNNGRATVDQSLTALNRARSCLRTAGYTGPVVVVDTFVAVLRHPELCDQSDYCAFNCHPFFDPNTGAPDAGTFVDSTIKNIRSKLSDPTKRVVVTETGWPWQGQPNGAAIPGLDHQSNAISSVKSAFSSNPADVFLFTAFNDLWKKPDASTFMAEQFWGMGGRYSPSDQ